MGHNATSAMESAWIGLNPVSVIIIPNLHRPEQGPVPIELGHPALYSAMLNTHGMHVEATQPGHGLTLTYSLHWNVISQQLLKSEHASGMTALALQTHTKYLRE